MRVLNQLLDFQASKSFSIAKINSIKLFKLSLLLSSVLLCENLIAHSEPGKARYVAATGQDTGFCDNALRPCKSIAFAVQKANKGDKVLIASGSYSVTSTEELFYLKSEIVPVLAGFNRFDHFQTQSPDVNPTFLAGVPADMHDVLMRKGFTIVRDGKSLQQSSAFQQKMKAYQDLAKFQAETPCQNGTAGNFPCNNIDLVAHIPLNSFSSSPGAANDIWGHVDLNNGKEYAVIGLVNGVAVVNVSDPANPNEVGTIAGSNSTWRDIKVYQFFDTPSLSWKAYAYATVDSAVDGVTIIDLNDLPNSISLVQKNRSVASAHNVYISNVDHSLNIKLDEVEPVLQLVGANRSAGSFNSYSLQQPATISLLENQSVFAGYTHDGASVLIDDARKDSDCFNGGINCSVFVDFNEKEMVLWDISNPADTRKLSEVTYNDVSSANKYIHSGWVTEDKRFILLHDEFDETYGGLNSTVRIFQIDSLRAPVQVGQWTGPTRAIDHNGFVRGNRYYMSNYERGVTILDISDPANPVETGFFDTFPVSNNASFNGAWGVYPYLPSGLILASDINSGLYILRDKSQSVSQGSVSFEAAALTVDSGEEVSVNVTRTDVSASSTSATVNYEMISGSALSGADFTATNGSLQWNGNESGVKSFTVSTQLNDSEEYNEEFFIRLYDPTSGMSLTSPAYLTININGKAKTGFVEFATDAKEVGENVNTATIQVQRQGGSVGVATINYQTIAGSAESGVDFIPASGTLIWDDGDKSNKTIEVTIIDDSHSESDESFSITLSDATGAGAGTKSQLQITIKDDESNTAPVISLGETFEVNSGQQVQLTANVEDAPDDILTYLWQQTDGFSVTIVGSTEAQASFTAPAQAGNIGIKLTVTDQFNASSSAQIQISVVAPEKSESSGGGAIHWITLILLVGCWQRRQLIS